MVDVVVQGQRLPGLGWRYDLPLDNGREMVVVVEDRGARHLMLVPLGGDEPLTSLRLSEEQAVAFAALLTGARFTVTTEVPPRPRSAEAPRSTVVVETVHLAPESPAVGQPAAGLAGMLGPDVALLGLICDETPDIVETNPGRRVQAGDRVVIGARPEAMSRLAEII